MYKNISVIMASTLVGILIVYVLLVVDHQVFGITTTHTHKGLPVLNNALTQSGPPGVPAQSMSQAIIPTWVWTPITILFGFIGIFITIIKITAKVTRHITQVEGKITIEATRLDGRINLLEERIRAATQHQQQQLDLQRTEITKLMDYFVNNVQAFIQASSKGEK
jgi:hypothetical protein